MGGICWRTMPGPLSVTVTRKRVAWLAGGGAAPLPGATSTVTTTSGRMPASSAASSALSTASLTQVRSALRGLSKPSRWRFLVKNSETEISRWRAPISAADGARGLARTVAIAFLDIKPVPAGPPKIRMGKQDTGLAGRAIVSVQMPIVLADDTEPEPDVQILRRRAVPYKDREADADDVLLLIEVAESSLAYDRSTKLGLYAAAGIPEYWVVDCVAESRSEERR